MTKTDAPSPFSATVPKLQLAWDSTSLGYLKTCPRYYQYGILEGWTLPFTNVHLDFGIWLHRAAELYDHARAEGLDHNAALCVSLRYAVLATWDLEKNRPWLSDEPTKTRKTLFRTIVWYLDKFQNDTIKTVILPNGKPAVEHSFCFGLSQGGSDQRFVAETGEEFLLAGHIDKIGDWNGSKWIKDIKTTKYELDDNYFRQYSPDNQISLYDIAGLVVLAEEIQGVIIDGCQILVTGTRFRRKPISRSAEQREEWLNDLSYWLAQAQLYARMNHWPMNEKSCGYGHRQCVYRPICSADPYARDDLLKGHYVKREKWNPLEAR